MPEQTNIHKKKLSFHLFGLLFKLLQALLSYTEICVQIYFTEIVR